MPSGKANSISWGSLTSCTIFFEVAASFNVQAFFFPGQTVNIHGPVLGQLDDFPGNIGLGQVQLIDKLGG